MAPKWRFALLCLRKKGERTLEIDIVYFDALWKSDAQRLRLVLPLPPGSPTE